MQNNEKKNHKRSAECGGSAHRYGLRADGDEYLFIWNHI